MRNLTIFKILVLVSGLSSITVLAGQPTVRQPLPSADTIAKLPADGGEEFNRLIFTQSPYLLQHARNPVDWWPWGPEAFAQADKENKPVFLSIGYTTCHWCHVMEHESFEDEKVAQLINQHFIPVKVDREERPDIDQVYMTVTQALTGRGGWPMTVLMTPAKTPFFAGTYYPKESQPGRPGIQYILTRINEAWQNDRDSVTHTATQLTKRLNEVMVNEPGGALGPEVFDRAFQQFSERFDPDQGGFGMAPKFPVPANLMFLMRYHKRTGNAEALAMVEKTLHSMRTGGIYDHVGYGIHRYSTDRVWLLPHFEKMLYDQAMAVMAYVEAYQITGKEFYSRTAREILSYVQRDMTHPEGGFYSAEDADSEGVEGKFYVWSQQEIREVLGTTDGQWFIDTFQLTEEGNFVEEASGEKTGDNIPHLKALLSDEQEQRLEPMRTKLFAHRETRIRPQKDDKVLTDWNGLMMSALARAGQALGDQTYIDTAQRSADFVLKYLLTDNDRLLKRFRNHHTGLTAHLQDYSFMVSGLLDVYEATFELRYLEKAIELQAVMDQRFWDNENLGYYMTADDSEELIVRVKRLYGGAIPSGNSASILNLARLHRITGDAAYADRTDKLVSAFANQISRSPMGFSAGLCGLDFHTGPSHEIVICGKQDTEDAAHMLSTIRTRFLPNKVVLFRTEQNAEQLAKSAAYTTEHRSIDGKATAYVCQDFTCQLPTTKLEKLISSLEPTN